MKLNEAQQADLKHAAQHHAEPHMRVKALALLNLAAGRTARDVAKTFLKSEPTVGEWKRRYEAEGLAGLEIKAGRGRKPKADTEEIAMFVKQSPRNFGIEQTRWTLTTLAKVVPSLRGFTTSGVYRALQRAGFSYKRGQPVQHSPDPEYDVKKNGLTKS